MVWGAAPTDIGGKSVAPLSHARGGDGRPSADRPPRGRRVSSFLLGIDTKHLVVAASLLAIVSSEIVACAVSIVMAGRILPVVAMAAFITPLVVAPAVSILLATVIARLRDEVEGRIEVEKQLRAAKEDAELANRAKSQFLANTSHELRTPLNAIIGFSDVIKNSMFGPVGNPKYVGYADHIYASGRHLLAVINDILDLSKVEAGKADLHECEVDVRTAVTACLTLVREQAETKRQRLEQDLADDLPALRADERRLKQILLNLLSNAVKFTGRGGQVTVKAYVEADGALVMEVADTGIGIAPEDIPKAFAPFSQIDGSDTRRYEGSGLGLPLARALAELHQASLDLESAVGVGTTAVVRFPAPRLAWREA